MQPGVPLIFAALVLFGTGCGRGEESKSLICDRSSYIRQSGEFKADEGKSSRAITTAQPIAKGYFGKPYNQDWLRNVGSASINDTITYIESKGAAVYQSKAVSEESARPFADARRMPWEIETRWNESESIRRSEACAFLGGLYLLKNPEVEPLKKKAAIVVREDGNRWTLVHEFMHHNFKIQSIAAGFDDKVAQKNRIDALTKLGAILDRKDLSEKEIAKRATPEFIKAVTAIDQLMVEYAFEEIAIEAMLQDSVDAGTLSYVPVGAYQNANLYIEAAKKNTTKIYAGMDGVYTRLRLFTSTNELNDDFNALAVYFDQREHRLEQLAAMFEEREAAHGFGYAPKNPNVLVSKDRTKAKPKKTEPKLSKTKNRAGAIVSDETYDADSAIAPCGHALEIDFEMAKIIRQLDGMNAN